MKMDNLLKLRDGCRKHFSHSRTALLGGEDSLVKNNQGKVKPKKENVLQSYLMICRLKWKYLLYKKTCFVIGWIDLL
jgi:hypothetical protein